MLPRDARLRASVEFPAVMRRDAGHARGSSTSLVVHLALPGAGVTPSAPASPRVGLAVPRAVGGAVVRNRVRRRLRALCRERLRTWPAGARLVVRALPPAATATYRSLGADLDRAAGSALARATTTSARRGGGR